MTLDPQWETTEQDSLTFTEALLTNTETIINREGNYTSKVFFIEVNDSIVSGIHSTFPESTFEDGNLKNGNIYFNDFEGKFLDAYKVTNGIITHRLIPEQNVQEASLVSFMFLLFQGDISDSLCWAEDSLDSEMPGFSLTFSTGGGSSSNSGTNSYYLFFDNNNYGGDPDEDDTYDGSQGFSSGNNWQNCTGGKLQDPNTGECECPNGKVEDANGNCINNPCTGGKIYDQNTGQCNCPDGKTENEKGECVDKTPCDNIKDQINRLEYIAKKNYLEGRTNLKEETGYAQNNDGTFTDALPVINGGHSLTLEGINYADITGFIHTHLNDFPTGRIVDGKEEENQIYRIFSPADVIAFLKIVKASTNPSSVYATVITSSGDYTLRFAGNVSDITGLKTAKEYKTDYIDKMKKYKTDKERGFLHFLKDHMSINGVQLYKQHKPLFNSTIKIQHKTLKSNGKVQTDDCV